MKGGREGYQAGMGDESDDMTAIWATKKYVFHMRNYVVGYWQVCACLLCNDLELWLECESEWARINEAGSLNVCVCLFICAACIIIITLYVNGFFFVFYGSVCPSYHRTVFIVCHASWDRECVCFGCCCYCYCCMCVSSSCCHHSQCIRYDGIFV